MTKSKIIKIDFNKPSQDTIDEAAAILQKGGVIVAPTETRYGLLARADSIESLEKLYYLKKRPVNMPTAVFAHSVGELDEIIEMSRLSYVLADKFLPGSLTIVAESKIDYPFPVVVNGKIGVRVSPAPFIERITEKADFLITATSANLSGYDECTTIDEIRAQFDDEADLYIDMGRLDNKTSTVVDISDNRLIVLREGAISGKEIKEIISNV